MNILTRHSDWLVKTQDLYNQILEFYYNLYLDTFEDGRPGSMEALRTLEKLTIPGRDRQPTAMAKGSPVFQASCDQQRNCRSQQLPLQRKTEDPFHFFHRIRYLL